MTEHTDQISVYPVGLLHDLKRARMAWRHEGLRSAVWRIRMASRYLRIYVRNRNWRAVRNYFNGHLAEHSTLGRRCGHGWTKRRALADLYRHLAEEAVR